MSLNQLSRDNKSQQPDKLARQQQKSSSKIEEEEWYLGMLNSADVEPYLKKVGDFAVRAREKDGEKLELVLTAMSTTQSLHFTISLDTGGWHLVDHKEDKRRFASLRQLVEHYKRNNLPGVGVRLNDAVKRPRWFLKHENLQYDPVSDKLGSGNFCDVYKGKLHGRRVVAIKLCHPTKNDNEDALKQHQNSKDALIQEANIMAEIQHPNIIQFYGICASCPPVMVVMEFCPGGSLLSHLETMKVQYPISPGERIRYCLEAAEGMSYLQDKGYIHRDLAARNCLISKYGIIKIADFGLSKIVSELKGNTEATLLQVPVRWMSPETLIPSPQFSIKSDVWSYGMLVYEIFSDGTKPWADWENKRIATHIRRGKMLDLPEQTVPEMKQLVKECWTLDPAKRCDFKYIRKKMSEIQATYPAPIPSESSIALISGVKAMTADEVGPFDVSEDIANEIAQSTIRGIPSILKSPQSVQRTYRQDREPTVEDLVLKNQNKRTEERLKEKHVEPLPLRHRASTGRQCIIERRNSRPSSNEGQGESKTGDMYDSDLETARKSKSTAPKKKKTSRKEDRIHHGGLKKRQASIYYP